MLSLRYSELVPRLPDGKIRLADVTGLYEAATNPGGYGGPNPLRADLSIYVLSSALLPGQLSYGLTTGAEAYDPATGTSEQEKPGVIRLATSQDAVLQILLLAVTHDPALSTEAGSLFVDLEGRVMKRLTTDGQLSEEVDLVQEGFLGLRENQPAALAAAEFGLVLLLAPTARQSTARLLLEYARAGSRSQLAVRSQWVNNTALLATIDELYAEGRYPECSAVLRQLNLGLGNRQAFYSGPVGVSASAQ